VCDVETARQTLAYVWGLGVLGLVRVQDGELLSAHRSKQLTADTLHDAPKAAPAASPARDASSSFVPVLLRQGLLTREQHANAMTMAEKKDPRVMGAISFYDRNRMRTALMLTKLTSSGGPTADDAPCAGNLDSLAHSNIQIQQCLCDAVCGILLQSSVLQ